METGTGPQQGNAEMNAQQKTARDAHDTLNAAIAATKSALDAVQKGSVDFSDNADDLAKALSILNAVQFDVAQKTGRAT
jgi:ABC-type transporter Mla subunit MlaD